MQINLEAFGEISRPAIGLGLDHQYADKYVFGGLKGLLNKFSLSHISIVSIPTVQEAIEFINLVPVELPILHHLSGIAPANPHGPNIEKLTIQAAISGVLNARWCLEDIGIWSIGPYDIPYFVPPVFNLEVAKLIVQRINKIQEIVEVPFLAEIPSCSFVVGDLSLGDFFHYLIKNTKCKMVLDVSHVFSYALATDSCPNKILNSLPLDAVWEIHVAGGRINKNHSFRYIDTHSDPVHEVVLKLLLEAIKACRNLQAITYEIGVRTSEDLLISDFKNLNDLVSGANFTAFNSQACIA